MTTRAYLPKAFAGVLVAALLPLACGSLIDFNDRPLTDNPPVKQDAGAPDAGANDDGANDGGAAVRRGAERPVVGPVRSSTESW